jgi:hypothetical protein
MPRIRVPGPPRSLPIVDAVAPPERLAMLRILTGMFAVVYLLVRLPVFLRLGDRRTGFDGVGLASILDAPVSGTVVDATIALTCWQGSASCSAGGSASGRSSPSACSHWVRTGLVGAAVALREPDGALPGHRRAVASGRHLVARRPPASIRERRGVDRVECVWLADRTRRDGARDHLRDRRVAKLRYGGPEWVTRRHAAQPRRVRRRPSRPPRWNAVTACRMGRRSRGMWPFVAAAQSSSNSPHPSRCSGVVSGRRG